MTVDVNFNCGHVYVPDKIKLDYVAYNYKSAYAQYFMHKDQAVHEHC